MIPTPEMAQSSTGQTQHLLADRVQRASTLTSYHDAVEQAIPTMHKRFSEPLSLQEMAKSVALSPYHFNRVFRKVTGITPSRFLCALRLQAAMQLLLTTQRSVTDVCFDVGYNSLGTFTTRFTQLIGLSPTQLRESVGKVPAPPELLAHHSKRLAQAKQQSGTAIQGRIITSDPSIAFIFVGFFSTTIPQGAPKGCVLLTGPGPYRSSAVPDGKYYLFAVGFPKSNDPLSYLMPDYTQLQVGMGRRPLQVSEDHVKGCADVKLRSIQVTDPPILSVLPLLLAKSVNSTK